MDCTTLIGLFDRGKICEIPPMNSSGELFPEICGYGRTDIAQWLYEKSKEDGNIKVTINALGNYAFRRSCENGHLATAQWLCTLTPEYTITFDGTNIKYCIKRVQDMIRQELIDGTIEKRYLDTNIMNDDGTLCPLCLSDELEKWVQFTDCTHQVCVDCYIDANSCPYNCNSNVRNIKMIKMIKNLIY